MVIHRPAKRLTLVLIILLFVLPSPSVGAPNLQPSQPKGTFRFTFEPVPDSGPIAQDSAIPVEIIEMSNKVFELYRQGDPQSALIAMRPLVGWIEANLPKTSIHRARSYFWMGILLNSLGRREEALVQQEEAVKLQREIAKTNTTIQTNLSLHLNLLSERYASLGRYEKALSVQEKSVEIARKLPTTNPDHLGNLLTSLQLLGNRYSDLGREKDALALREAMHTKMLEHIKSKPGDLPNMLGYTLMPLTVQYSSMGRKQEAVDRLEEAVRVCRELLKSDKGRAADLAISLNMLAIFVSFLDRWNDAIKAIDESITIQRVLAKIDPIHLPGLASSLKDAGYFHYSLGQLTLAASDTEEALKIQRNYERSQSTNQPDYFKFYNNQSQFVKI